MGLFLEFPSIDAGEHRRWGNSRRNAGRLVADLFQARLATLGKISLSKQRVQLRALHQKLMPNRSYPAIGYLHLVFVPMIREEEEEEAKARRSCQTYPRPGKVCHCPHDHLWHSSGPPVVSHWLKIRHKSQTHSQVPKQRHQFVCCLALQLSETHEHDTLLHCQAVTFEDSVQHSRRRDLL